MIKNKKTKQVVCRMSESMKSRLELHAKKHDLPEAAIIRKALQKFLQTSISKYM